MREALLTRRPRVGYINTYVPTYAEINTNEKPEIIPFTEGTQISVSLRGVVGFSEVILKKLIATFDAELVKTINAEGISPEVERKKRKSLFAKKHKCNKETGQQYGIQVVSEANVRLHEYNRFILVLRDNS